LQRSDIVEFVNGHASEIAAPDVAELVAEAATLRAKAETLRGTTFQPLRRQVNDAIDCLDDYLAGRCPQIPYHTIAVLSAALFYFRKPVDALPDCLPQFGSLDDAVVMAVATEVAAKGLQRYRTWKSTSSELREPETLRAQKTGRRRASRPRG